MKEMFVKSTFILNKSGKPFNDNNPSNTAGLWWTLWIISAVINQFIIRSNSTTVSDYVFISNISLLSDVISITLAFVTINMINKYSQIEKSLATM